MKRLAAVLLALSCLPTYGQTALFPELTGADLRQEIRDEYAPTAPLTYGQAREAMFGVVDNNAGQVELAYTSELFPISASSPIPNPNVVNTEHTWPQSMFSHDNSPGMKTDLHHLFPCRNPVNAARGNKPFAEILDTSPHRWWKGPTSLSSEPTSEKDSYSEGTGAVFEPEENHKGNVARAMVYFFTIYENEPPLVDSFFPPQTMTFKAWHVHDPVDAVETARNQRVENAQGNLNPFILDPTLLDRALVGIADGAPSVAVGGGGSPGSPPSPITPAAGATTVTGVSVVALLPNPDGQDEGHESVTLGNPTDAEIDLTGWKLIDRLDRAFPLTVKVPAGETVSIKLTNSKLILGNRGGEVSLVDAGGQTRHTVAYTKQQATSGAFVVFGD